MTERMRGSSSGNGRPEPRVDAMEAPGPRAVDGLVLAIDCSQRTSHLAIEAATGGALVARAFEATPGATPREAFWDALRSLFEEARVGPDALAAIAVAVGPGGFTGLRVSIAFAKSTAYARGIPAIALPSAEVFAASDAARGRGAVLGARGPWLVALAAKGESAWVVEVGVGVGAGLGVEGAEAVGVVKEVGVFREVETARETASVDVRAIDSGRVVDLSACADALQGVAARGGVLLADEHLPEAFARRAADLGIPRRPIATDARALVALARARLRTGARGDPYELAPLYPREPEAVTKWRERREAGR